MDWFCRGGRPAAPIQRAVLAGDRESGVTIMRMDEGLDTGPMLLTEVVPVGEATSGELQEKLSGIGARLMAQALASLDTLREVTQPTEGVTYAKKLTKEEARLDWSLSAAELARRVRGYNPVPVAWTELDGERVKIFRAKAVAGTGAAGAVLKADAGGIVVAAGEGSLSISELQWPGGKPLTAQQAAAGRTLSGKRFS
jgi:methionyl-tRNA formyltransferase